MPVFNPTQTEIKQIEIDFGSLPTYDTKFTVIDTEVTTSSNILGWIAYVAPTGKELDEVEMDLIELKFGADNGQFYIFAKPMEGYVADKFKVNYIIG